MATENSFANRLHKSIGHLLEERSPALSRAFLSAASSLATPFAAGMGLTVERLDDLGCVAKMPDWWRNRDENGGAHPAAVATLAQFATRSYWDRHLDPRATRVRLSRLDCRFPTPPTSGPATGALQAEFAFADDAREGVLFHLRGNGRVEAVCVAQVFDSAGRRVAEVEVEWEFTVVSLLGRPEAPAGEGQQE